MGIMDVSNLDDTQLSGAVAGAKTAAALSATYVAATVVVGTGIDATGTTNSAAAIQAKITAAGAGGTVYFPKGTFLADGLVPLSGQTWTGPGMIKRPNASTASMITGADINGLSIVGPLIIDGNRTGATATSSSAVSISRATHCLINGVTFQNMPTNNPAVQIYGGYGNRIIGNGFFNVGYGINLCLAYGVTDPTYDNVISGNTFDGVDLNGIFITENIGSQAGTVTGRIIGTSITNNSLRNCGDVGIEVGSGSVDTAVAGNSVISATGASINSTGILIRDATGVAISGNVIAGYTGASSVGIVNVALNGLRTTNLAISGNSIRGCANGMKIQDADGVTITGGSIVGSIADGIVLVNPTRWDVSNVTIHQAGQGGITIGTYNATSATDGSITNCTITDSSFSVAGRDGISAFLNSANFTLANNRIFDTRATGKTQRYGINISGATITNYNIIGNVLTGNLTGGLNDLGPASPKNVAYNL